VIGSPAPKAVTTAPAPAPAATNAEGDATTPAPAATDTPTLPPVVSGLFTYSKCKNYGSIANWDLTNSTDASLMFSYSNFNVDISGWNVSNITNMSNLFENCPFNKPLNNWNVSNVTNMTNMFKNNTAFNQPLSNWNVNNVINFEYMFNGASSFNQDLTMWKFNNKRSVSIQSIFTSSAYKYPWGNFDYSRLSVPYSWSPSLFNISSNDLLNTISMIGLSINNSYMSLPLSVIKENAEFSIKNFVSGGRFLQTSVSTAAYNILSANDSRWTSRSTIVTPNPTTFKSSNYSTKDLRTIGYTITQLINDAGYTLTDLSNSEFKKADYAAIPYTITDLSNARFSADNFLAAGYSFTELIQGGISLSKFASSSLSKKSNYTSYTIPQLVSAGFSLLSLQTAGYVKIDFQSAGYTPSTLKNAGFTIPILKSAGYTLTDIVSAGYSLSQIKDYGFTKTNYTTAGYTIYDLKLTGFKKADYKTAGYSPLDLLNSNLYSLSDLMNTLKYTYADLIPAGCMPEKRGLIFDIATKLFNDTTYLWDTKTFHPKIPIININNTFVDLSYSSISIASTGLTTVFVSWSSYNRNTILTNGDGFVIYTATMINLNELTYTKSLNILQYGGIPITNVTSFRQYKGIISAMDTPEILRTNLNFFFWFSKLKSFGNIGAWDVSGVTSFQYTFADCPYFNDDIGKWNVSNATSFYNMFSNENNKNTGGYFNQDISNWNVSNVTSFVNMFAYQYVYNQPIGNWNMSKATDLSTMFKYTNFTQNISTWNTQNVTTINGIFDSVGSPVPNIGGWNFTKIKNVDNFVTTPLNNMTNYILAITAVFRTLSNNSTYCLGTDPSLPLLDVEPLEATSLKWS
jgi:surface protein